MSVVHPSPAKLEALRARWRGQEERLRRIAADLVAGEDWTVHLAGLPYVHEVPPVHGEAHGRDLRGADLRRLLHPPVLIQPATIAEAALVAGITLEAMRNNTPLPDTSPFPAAFEGAEQMAVAIRRGEVFMLARCGASPAGVIRVAQRSEFREFTGNRPYAEISGLAVRPAWRRIGIGRRLIDAAEAYARDDGHRFLLLRTTWELGLVPYYEGLGYEPALTRQQSYPGSPTFLDVVMRKVLARPAGAGRRLRLRAQPR